ncbi:zinc-binding dehydrogenase [Nonomuraea sp. NPDC050680]|uniref:zinc-binding dehydrogenase n=1 Tax=Nonomuraea sp. NPDC050680 TaxID=3154630 RepID=UPI0033CE5F28
MSFDGQGDIAVGTYEHHGLAAVAGNPALLFLALFVYGAAPPPTSRRVPSPTPALRATSCSDASAPCAVTTVRATARRLAKWKRARVVAVASGAHESFLRTLGAEEFLDYTKSRPEELIHDLDLVLDTVGGRDSGRFLRTLKRGGALYPVFPGDFDDEEIAKLGVTVSGTQVRSNGAQLAELGRLLDAGTVRVAIDSTFALAEARAAHERAARGHIQGKIVLTVA